MNPFIDIAFKRLFGQETSKESLIAFLNDRDTGEEVVGGKLRQIYLCLPHFRKEPEECVNDYERWIYLIKNMKTLEQNPFEAAKAKFGRFLDVAEIENLPSLERRRYEEKLKSFRDYVNTISFAEERGLRKGREEGLTEAKSQIALNLKSTGVDIRIIAQSTGLSVDEIARL